ncbi:electron transfer flavoprotein subunit beta/FixA family protein [Leucobacter massiliensis]|uniref:Electron transfer flavoprotein subunit beta n=1 Tax=Leucobacter massiliensis TaxID=1686285 RepID=A0A2S9QMF7_9MICO|nr:electron transfer flavoprotein subunit beta/FixA family protein [Leucobacter massiliensis]PRI10760.1 electron transfer flavoprotein subunit beta [Leucobacter massiliensis]
MKIVVLLKEVPDTYGERELSLETGLAVRAGGENVLDEICERALEVALSHADANDGVEVTLLAMSPEGATASVRKGLAMGADAATHIVDDGLAGADLGLTAEVLAAALRAEGFDLVLAGNQSTDGMGGMVPVWLAELLGVPAVTNLSEVTIGADGVSGARVSDGATQRVTAPLPAVASITEALPDARFPSFKGIMAAKKKPIEVKSLGDYGIDANDLGPSRAIMLSLAERPPRTVGVKIVDEGDGAQRLAAFLAENKLI